MNKIICVIVCAICCIGGFTAGAITIYNLTATNEKHEDGEWYYYTLASENNGEDMRANISRWRSDEKYSTFEECKNAFHSRNNDYAVGGCVRDCEIRPWDAYIVRTQTCKEVVEL